VPDWQRLHERREPYRMGTAPAGVVALTAGADVRRDRIEVDVWGWGPSRERRLVDHVVIDGRRPSARRRGRRWAYSRGCRSCVSGSCLPSTVDTRAWMAARASCAHHTTVHKGKPL
jgi:phage terminase large subunit GpA-like protein